MFKLGRKRKSRRLIGEDADWLLRIAAVLHALADELSRWCKERR